MGSGPAPSAALAGKRSYCACRQISACPRRNKRRGFFIEAAAAVWYNNVKIYPRAAGRCTAGVSDAAAEALGIEMDYEDGKMVYDIEFLAGGYEYEYDIDAATGAVLKAEKERR